MSSSVRILVIGAGVGGPTLAYFLSKSPSRKFEVTVLERSQELRTAGQNVDIRGAGADVIKIMGLEEAIRGATTAEEGVVFVDSDNNTKATFPADKSGQVQTFTSDLEIVRGKLAMILYEATKDKAEYIFGDYASSLEQAQDKVRVTFAKGHEPRDFDIVVGADGLGSKTRSLVFGKESESWHKPLGMFASFFTIPMVESDGYWSRWYSAPRRRTIMLRPDNEGATRAWMSIMSEDKRLKEVLEKGVGETKLLMKELFEGAGWETERVIKGMEEADDYYYDEIAQIKMPKWSKGRVVLLGDAGYCASPISGMGTTLAFTGAYHLAGELIAKPDDHVAAFAKYEEVLRPLVTKAQKLPPGAPSILNPETAWGVYILNNVLSVLTWTGIANFMAKFVGPPARGIELKEYGF